MFRALPNSCKFSTALCTTAERSEAFTSSKVISNTLCDQKSPSKPK